MGGGGEGMMMGSTVAGGLREVELGSVALGGGGETDVGEVGLELQHGRDVGLDGGGGLLVVLLGDPVGGVVHESVQVGLDLSPLRRRGVRGGGHGERRLHHLQQLLCK